MRTTLALFALVAMAPSLTAADPQPVPLLPSGPICGESAKSASSPAAPAQQLLAGYGTGGFAVRTASPQAQAYFDNGMQLAHAFAHKPAIAAFKEAERLDPTCAMCAWGEAWARGPTINYTIEPKDQAELAALTDKAADLAKDGPVLERQLIAALRKRYRDGGGKGRGDDAFAGAIDQLSRAHPNDNELAVIAADAWMIPAANQENQDHLPRALALLTGALTRQPTDTGAIHFYIHATEMSGFGGQAEAFADTLKRLAPAASHLTHMPSHTYYIVGRYEDAVTANLAAIQLDAANAKRQGLGEDVWKLSYHGHNVQFAIGAALMSGDAEAALVQSDAVLSHALSQKELSPWGQFIAGTAYFAQGRFAAPDHMLDLADPGAARPFLRAMWRYGRGEALARKGDAVGVRREAAAIVMTPADLKPFEDYAPQTAAMAEVARLVLEGRAAMIEAKPDLAAEAYRRAASIQDGKLRRIGDPPGWWYPVRRSYAAALLKSGRMDDAARQARLTLKDWPKDPVTLSVLAGAEKALGDGKAADFHLAQAKRGWRGGRAFARMPGPVGS